MEDMSRKKRGGRNGEKHPSLGVENQWREMESCNSFSAICAVVVEEGSNYSC